MRPLQLPVPKQFTLANGLTVMLFEQHRLPLVSANLVVLAGSDRNPVARPGLASFTADVMDEGTKTRSNRKIAEDLATMGASISSGSTTDYSSVSLRSLKNTADNALDILADIVQNPAFAPEEIERVRSSRQTQLLQQNDNPDALARRALYEALYGTQHPYGYIELGTPQSNRQHHPRRTGEVLEAGLCAGQLGADRGRRRDRGGTARPGDAPLRQLEWRGQPGSRAGRSRRRPVPARS